MIRLAPPSQKLLWSQSSWKLFPKVQMTINQHLISHAFVTKSHYLNQWWRSSLTPMSMHPQVPMTYFSFTWHHIYDNNRIRKHIEAEWRIYASLNWVIIGSDNGLSPVRRQAITWTNVGILLIGPLGTNFSEILIETHTFSFKKTHLKLSSGKWCPFCLGLNVLKWILDIFVTYLPLRVLPSYWNHGMYMLTALLWGNFGVDHRPISFKITHTKSYRKLSNIRCT